MHGGRRRIVPRRKVAGFSDQFISELKYKNDIVSVISQYVPLTRKGSKYFCCCPFHNEKTASMCVNADGQYYHCFGCGVSGDVITFVMEMESLSYVEAIKFLAERANMTLPEFKGDAEYHKKKERGETLRNLMRDAAAYYHANLVRENEGKEARAYLDSRGITENIRTSFGLGLSLGYDQLQGYMRRKGYAVKDLVACGLVNGERLSDAFAGRIIVPIMDGMGNVIAFGGRIYRGEENVAKYKNSTNTVLFDKSRSVYGVNFVKKEKKRVQGLNEIILVEGYMDVISLAAGGFRNAVACMGTALTPLQAREIKKLASTVYVCYDGDAAGRKAAIKNVDPLIAEGLEVKVVSLADGCDPDDTVRKEGADGFAKRVREALPVIEYKLKVCADACDLRSATGRARYVSAALNVLAKVDGEAEREVYYNEVSAKSGVSVDTLRRQFATRGKAAPVAPKRETEVKSSGTKAAKNVRAARFVLNAMFRKCHFADVSDVIPEWLPNDALRKIYAWIVARNDAEAGRKGGAQGASGAQAECGSETSVDIFRGGVDKEELDAVLASETEFGAEGSAAEATDAKFYSDCLTVLGDAYAAGRIKELTEKYKSSSDAAEQGDILRQITVWQKKAKSKNPKDKLL